MLPPLLRLLPFTIVQPLEGQVMIPPLRTCVSAFEAFTPQGNTLRRTRDEAAARALTLMSAIAISKTSKSNFVSFFGQFT